MEVNVSSFINICSIVAFLSIRDLPTGKVLNKQVKLVAGRKDKRSEDLFPRFKTNNTLAAWWCC